MEMTPKNRVKMTTRSAAGRKLIGAADHPKRSKTNNIFFQEVKL